MKPKVEKKKEKVKKVEDDAPLSDPLAEKLRQQRYQCFEKFTALFNCVEFHEVLLLLL